MTGEDTYYACRYAEARLKGEMLTWATRPALGPPRDRLTSALILAECASAAPGDSVLHMHCGEALAAAAVARRRPDAPLSLLDAHVAATEAACCTLAANGMAAAEIELSDCGQTVLDRRYDRVLSLLPKGRAVWEQTILDAATVLRPGGSLYLAGANNAGIKTAHKFVERVFGRAFVLGYRGGCRAIHAVRPQLIDLPPSDYYAWRTHEEGVGGMRLAYATKPGLFSWQRLDDGTRFLIETLLDCPLRANDAVLDIGSGSGVLSLVAARLAPQGTVVAVDADCRAVDATRRTLAANGITNAEVRISDCAWAVRDRAFSAVVTNPPFHRQRETSYAVVEQIVRDAARLLVASGRLYLVANRFLRYGPLIERAFGNATPLRQDSRYTVWYATQA